MDQWLIVVLAYRSLAFSLPWAIPFLEDNKGMAGQKEISFSIGDFLRIKDSIKIQLYDQCCINEDGSVITFPDQAAIVTHYLNLKGTSKCHIFEEKAKSIINSWVRWTNPSISKDNYASEPLEPYNLKLFNDVYSAPFKPVSKPSFTFIDLFAGIGGFRIAMQNCGGECIYSSEWDENAKQTYYYNFGDVPFGDITKENNKQLIPDGFDILCAGFPCQAFSIAGYRKGFEDTRGTLFFDVAEIIKRKRPKAIFLENVKNLYTHDHGKTFAVIKETLEDMGYVVYHKVMNAMEYSNVPQNRERIFIVCFDPTRVPNHTKFSFPEKEELTHKISDCIDTTITDAHLFYDEKFSHYDELKRSMTSINTIYQWRRQYVRENKSNVCPTLTANMGTGGHNVPLILTKNGIRKLSPKECINFQGYPVNFNFPTNIANSAKYKQAGNSVVVPLITKVCQQITSIL